MTRSRHHHYLSQCYLKGFTQGSAKKSKLTVIDLKDKKLFPTIPRNVGGIRDFNRVEIEDIDPEIVEKEQSEFESKAATALRKLGEALDFSGDTKDVLLELIGMLSIKSPEMREHLAKPLIEIAKKVTSMTLESEDRWNSQVEQLKADTGIDVSEESSFEEIKEFFDQQLLDITVKQEHQIHMELLGMRHITDLLHERNWVLLRAEEGAGEFITCDNPVSLTWHYPDKVPPFMSPGFGLKDTMVYFPVSKRLALVGEFNRKDEVKDAGQRLIAILNSKMIANSHQRVFASKDNFYYIQGHEIKTGNYLLKK